MRAFALIVVASVLSGLLFAWALPPCNASWLGWLALAPMFAAVKGRGFILGFLAGAASLFVCALAIQYGLTDRAGPSAGEPGWLYTGCGFFGFVVALVTAIVADSKDLGPWRMVWLAAVAVLLESVLLVVLPAHLALTQSSVPTMLRLASVTGIWGVSYVLWLSNLALAEALVRRNAQRAVILVIVAGAICAVPWLGGKADSSQEKLITAVQSDDCQVEDMQEWERWGRGSWLEVWPEFSGMMATPRGDTRELRELAAPAGNPPFVTSFPDDHSPLPHNTAALFSAKGESARYFKRKLFGGEVNMHAPGDRAESATLDGQTIGLAICYDSCFPAMLRQSARAPGVSLIALPTIDPPSPHAFVAAIHAAFTPFRAAELGVPIVRADGMAYSMAVDASGRVLAVRLPGPGYLTAQVPLESRWTVYKAFGDWFLYLCGAVGAAGVLRGLQRRLRKESAAPELADLQEERPLEPAAP